MANEANLTSWSGGTSGNPNGRPKGKRNRSTIAREVLSMLRAIPGEMMEKLREIYPSLPEGMSVEEVMTLAIVERVITKADPFAYTAIMDSAYGKTPQPIDILEESPQEDLSKLTNEELEQYHVLLSKVSGQTIPG